MAMEIQTGNSDVEMRFDNTVRYNLGVRTEKADPRIAHSTGNDLSDGKFGRGDIVNNRLDLLSEFDFRYQRKFGFRVSAASWYDNAYRNSKVSPYGSNPSEFDGNRYTNTVDRYYNGPSGELLDAFVFGSFDAGSVPVSLKLGKHVIYWGEGALIGPHAISYSQAPSDGRKAQASPGIETKEVFRPISQLSATAQLTNDLSIAGQYYLDWSPTTAPSGGTFLANADVVDSSRLWLSPTMSMPYVTTYKPKKKSGSFGLSARYNLASLDSTLGFYFRKFDDFSPWSLMVGPGGAGFVYAEDVKLYGVSLGTTINGVSVGSELSYRQDAPLNSTSINAANREGARGDTLHAILNATGSLPNAPLWDTGTYVLELAASHLSKVTSQSNLFKGVGYSGCTAPSGVAPGTNAKEYGCSTKNYIGISAVFMPQYLQVAPGLDLSVPIRVSYGLKGNSANAGSSGTQGEYTYSVGVVANYQFKHEFSLTYTDRYYKTAYNAANSLAIGGASSLYPLNDRGSLTFTYKTAF